MPVTITPSLDSAKEAAVRSMIGEALKKEPVTVSFPFEGASLYALFEDGDSVLSALALTEEFPDSMECCAFTHPAFRRRGLFSELLDQIMNRIPEDTDLLFYADHKSADTMASLAALEAELLFDEYMMELPASGAFRFTGTPTLKKISVSEEVRDGVRTRIYRNAFGSLCISVFSSCYYLYGFEIREPYRNSGHGTALLLAVLSDLFAIGPLPVRLQVSGSNEAALSLYKKTGFQITEILSCYLY